MKVKQTLQYLRSVNKIKCNFIVFFILISINVSCQEFKYDLNGDKKTDFVSFDRKNYKINVKFDGYTNLRKEKSTTSAALEKVETGQIVEVIEKSGDRYLVKTKAGNEGYVFKTKIVAK